MCTITERFGRRIGEGRRKVRAAAAIALRRAEASVCNGGHFRRGHGGITRGDRTSTAAGAVHHPPAAKLDEQGCVQLGRGTKTRQTQTGMCSFMCPSACGFMLFSFPLYRSNLGTFPLILYMLVSPLVLSYVVLFCTGCTTQQPTHNTTPHPNTPRHATPRHATPHRTTPHHTTPPQHLTTLLGAYDDDLAMAALRALSALSTPPLTHKCLDENRHTTSLHRSTALCNPLFDIIEAAGKASQQVEMSAFVCMNLCA